MTLYAHFKRTTFSNTVCKTMTFHLLGNLLPMYMTVALSRPSACIFLDSDISEVPWHSGICMDAKARFAL